MEGSRALAVGETEIWQELPLYCHYFVHDQQKNVILFPGLEKCLLPFPYKIQKVNMHQNDWYGKCSKQL